MAAQKRSGGPKSEEGKAKSSRNALKLGLSTMNPADSEEQHMVNEYVNELTHYYQPDSPLEKLQIQRIAICRAKLARLYQVEQLRLALAQKNIEGNPEDIFKEMKIAKSLVRSMALEGIRHGAITLPWDLTEQTLNTIVREVDRFHGTLKDEADLIKFFPNMVKFLHQYSARGLVNPHSLLERFEAIVRRLYVIMRQDIYLGNLSSILHEIFSQGRKTAPAEDEDVTALMTALNPSYVPPEPTQNQIDVRQLQSLLPLFVHLKSSYEEAQKLIVRYQETKSLLIESALLPQSEADLLMRYQTTLERRLSSSLGELLELQKRRK